MSALRRRISRRWVSATARGSASHIARLASLTAGLPADSVTAALGLARKTLGDDLQRIACREGWGVDTCITWTSEWSDFDEFTVTNATSLSDGSVWTAMQLALGSTIRMRIQPASRNPYLNGDGAPSIFVPHEIVDARVVDHLSGDRDKLMAYQRRMRRDSFFEWVGFVALVLFLVVFLWVIDKYAGIPLWSGVSFAVTRITNMVRTVWRVLWATEGILW